MKTIPLIVVLNVLLFLAGPLLAQSTDADAGYPTYSLDELEVELYTPEFVNVNELFGTIRATYGRSFLVSENGSIQDAPRNVQMLGDSLLIYDTADYRTRVLAAAEKLDVPGASNSQHNAPLLRESDLGLFEYSPRFMSIDAIQEALQPFTGYVRVAKADTTSGWDEIPRISVSYASRLVIVRDVPSRVMQVKGLLERIDVPEPHVAISCMVLRATRASGDEGLPAELVKNLSALVPYDQFNLVTMGLITTAVASGSSIELKMPLASGGSDAQAFMVQEAYDPATRALTLNRFSFTLHGAAEFTTRATITAGEYLVIGASGPQPVFVVLRLETVSS